MRRVEGLDELSWGELEGQDYKVEPFQSRLAALKQAWDDGIFDRWGSGEIDPACGKTQCTRLVYTCSIRVSAIMLPSILRARFFFAVVPGALWPRALDISLAVSSWLCENFNSECLTKVVWFASWTKKNSILFG